MTGLSSPCDEFYQRCLLFQDPVIDIFLVLGAWISEFKEVPERREDSDDVIDDDDDDDDDGMFNKTMTSC